ncbi:hypothetical protein DIZ81_01795 [Legionella taurinensis]|uniref:Uncharacterized protein n=1 Tax=Legionella taurinensis TaxID=70611 RepID=A0A3A5LW46_9GAMM|nr:hypothetical protein DB744_01800 [Legionella taurinensis]PUT45052.1 hypothetical protein DB743_06755 [Legionella taurinensis]PUT45686.1 hypothetical protein DB746_01800 [Legionella taurinensis]PUT49455.1 hypothetical protein DB745_01800 [Legionella taurinensis]RJT49183.1 hypothetical protein D6J04_00555 [Legionella taurinensis]
MMPACAGETSIGSPAPFAIHTRLFDHEGIPGFYLKKLINELFLFKFEIIAASFWQILCLKKDKMIR